MFMIVNICSFVIHMYRMLSEDIAKLMSMIPLDEENRRQNDADKVIVSIT